MVDGAGSHGAAPRPPAGQEAPRAPGAKEIRAGGAKPEGLQGWRGCRKCESGGKYSSGVIKSS